MDIKNTYTLALTSENIDKASDLTEDFLVKKKIERPQVIRTKLSLEDALLNWQAEFGDECLFTLTFSKFLGRVHILIQCKERLINPLQQSLDQEDSWILQLRSQMECVPTFEYKNNTNEVLFTVERITRNKLLVTATYIVLGIIIGFAGLFLPESLRVGISEYVLQPAYDAYLGLFGSVGIPLIFLSVLTGIIGVGNTKIAKGVGAKMVKGFIISLATFTILALVLSLSFFRMKYGQSNLHVNIKSISDMVYDIFPNNILQTFINCNAMQLVFLGFACAMALLTLGKTNGVLAEFFNDINAVLLYISKSLASLIPVFIELSLISKIWTSNLSEIMSAWKSFVITTSGQLIALLILALKLSIKHKANIFIVFKKISKVFFVALGTNSCSASIDDNYNCCSTKMGIDSSVYSYGIPLGTSLFKPATAIRLVLLAIFMADASNMSISIGWIAMLFVLAIMFSIAAPAVPGGVMLMCSLFFSSLGISTEVISQMLTTDFIFDCVCTACNQVSVTLQLANFAGKSNLLNIETLRKDC